MVKGIIEQIFPIYKGFCIYFGNLHQLMSFQNCEFS